MERKIIYFGDYFKDFIESLNTDVREKIKENKSKIH